MMKGSIIAINKILLPDCVWKYEVTVHADEEPDLKLGKCEIKQ